MTSKRAIILLVVLPTVALLPDITQNLYQRIFNPTPTDAVMLKQQRDPDYRFTGFENVFVPELPREETPDKLKRLFAAKSKIAEREKQK